MEQPWEIRGIFECSIEYENKAKILAGAGWQIPKEHFSGVNKGQEIHRKVCRGWEQAVKRRFCVNKPWLTEILP